MYLVVCFDESYMLPSFSYARLFSSQSLLDCHRVKVRDIRTQNTSLPSMGVLFGYSVCSFLTCICPEAAVSALPELVALCLF